MKSSIKLQGVCRSSLFTFLLFGSVGCFGDDIVDLNYVDDVTMDSESPTSCNPDDEPTWEDPVHDILWDQCRDCHDHNQYVNTYNTIQAWVTSGELKTYCEKGSGHHIDEEGQAACLRWLAIGAPEGDCDVVVEK
jgi:hypothetical protein